jgi:peptidoglycan/xylan/chitin deacetylase (PgdA/CDA1 family)
MASPPKRAEACSATMRTRRPLPDGFTPGTLAPAGGKRQTTPNRGPAREAELPLPGSACEFPTVPSARDSIRPLVRDVAARALYRTGLTWPRRTARELLTIVTFHRVLPEAAYREYPIAPIAVSDLEFGWMVEFFRRNYTCGTLGDTHRRWGTGERPDLPFLALTFDDGQLDNHEHALPILDAAGVKASFFVPIGAVDGNTLLWHDQIGNAVRRLMSTDRPRAMELLGVLGALSGHDDAAQALDAVERSKRLSPGARLDLAQRLDAASGGARPDWDGIMGWDHLRSLVRGGHEVGSHSISHAILTQVDDAQLEHEVRGSRDRLRAELGAPCESFCYPNGNCDDRVAEAVRRAGYLRAVTTAWGTNAAGADPFRLRRCDSQSPRVRDRKGRLSEPRLALRMSRFFPGPVP